MPKRTTQKDDPPKMKRIIFGKRASDSRGPSRGEIEQRAYQIFLERGGTDGHAEEDWLQAEYELRREKGRHEERMMEKPADTQHPIHDLFKRRWSPRAFSDQPIEAETLRSALRGRPVGAIFQQRATLAIHRRNEGP